MNDKPSILERLARKIEPKDDAPRSRARMIRQMKDIEEAQEVYAPGEVPKPTNSAIRSLDQRDTYVFFTDGSLRNVQRKLTKEERRNVKRAKRHVKRFHNPK